MTPSRTTTLFIPLDIVVEIGVAADVATVSFLYKVVEAVVETEVDVTLTLRIPAQTTTTTVQKLWLGMMVEPSQISNVLVVCLLDTIAINVHTSPALELL